MLFISNRSGRVVGVGQGQEKGMGIERERVGVGMGGGRRRHMVGNWLGKKPHKEQTNNK